MKKRTFFYTALAMTFALPTAVLAQPEAPKPPHAMGGGMMKKMGEMHVKHMFEMMDADGNGSISKAEIMDHRNAMFAAADEDGDGALSAEEAKAHMKQMRAQMHEQMQGMMEEMGGMHEMGEMEAMESMDDRPGMMLLRREDMPAPGDGERVITRVIQGEDGEEHEMEIHVEVQAHEHDDGEGHGGEGHGGEDHGMREEEHVIILHDGEDGDGEPRVMRWRTKGPGGMGGIADMRGGMLMRMDVDGDHMISREEFDVAGHRQFRDMDADGNGEVSEIEVRFAQRAMMKNMMRGMHGGGAPHVMRRMMHHGPGKDAPKPDHHK